MKRSNNKDEKVNSDIFNKNAMDSTLQNRLKEEMTNVTMSSKLKQNILEHTIKRPQSIYYKFIKFLNSSVEIPISYVFTICSVIFICSTLSTFIVTDNMKMNKSLQGYTSIRVLKISGSSIILPKDISEVLGNEEN